MRWEGWYSEPYVTLLEDEGANASASAGVGVGVGRRGRWARRGRMDDWNGARGRVEVAVLAVVGAAVKVEVVATARTLVRSAEPRRGSMRGIVWCECVI